MKRAVATMLALVSFPAFAAIETTTITGTVYSPDGSVATGGSITCVLTPQPGRASDGTNMQVVGSRYVATISGSGTVSFTLVPNDVISPSGTAYACAYLITGPLRANYTETWSVATAPDPVSIGSVTRVGGPSPSTPAPGTLGTVVLSNGVGGYVGDSDLVWDATNNRMTFGPSGYCGLDTPPGGAGCDAPPWSGRTLTTSYIRKNGVDYMLWIDWDHDSSTSGADTCLIGEQEAVGGSGISTDCTGQTPSILHFRRLTNGGRDYPLLQSGVGNGNGANLGLAVGYTIDPTVGPAGVMKLELEDVNGAFGVIPDAFDYVGWGGGSTANTPYFGTDANPWYQVATNKIMLEGATKDAIDIFMTPDDPIGTDPQQTIPTYSGSIAYGIFESTADVTVANQGAETTLIGSGNGSATINGSVLRAGSTLTINASGFHGALANADPQIRIKLGGTTFCDTGATLDVPATTAQAWFATCTITIRGAPGAAVAAHGQGNFEFFSATGTSKRFSTAKTSTSNLATNGSLAIAVTVDWDAASATNTITATNLTASAIR